MKNKINTFSNWKPTMYKEKDEKRFPSSKENEYLLEKEEKAIQLITSRFDEWTEINQSKVKNTLYFFNVIKEIKREKFHAMRKRWKIEGKIERAISFSSLLAISINETEMENNRRTR